MQTSLILSLSYVNTLQYIRGILSFKSECLKCRLYVFQFGIHTFILFLSLCVSLFRHIFRCVFGDFFLFHFLSLSIIRSVFIAISLLSAFFICYRRFITQTIIVQNIYCCQCVTRYSFLDSLFLYISVSCDHLTFLIWLCIQFVLFYFCCFVSAHNFFFSYSCFVLNARVTIFILLLLMTFLFRFWFFAGNLPE